MHCDLCTLLDGYASKQGLETLLWRSDRLAVVAVDDAAYPGFCRVIWNKHVKEMTDLTPGERNYVMEVVWQVELAVREVMQPEKVNVASFGNMTPHVHWHVIPRYRDDAHFPHPSWAVVQRETPAAVLAERRALLPALRTAIIQRLSA
ncbi:MULTISPECIES: HIT family protein [unclassified Janthinobacterium]|uniref:HIT family protein n=1 Tax=unclassified Janthinobacterium TaxID=2610881 RepID=UPI00288C0F66|nr:MULTISPECIES: HIT family protein [unclassified Janthinobacterium]